MATLLTITDYLASHKVPVNGLQLTYDISKDLWELSVYSSTEDGRFILIPHEAMALPIKKMSRYLLPLVNHYDHPLPPKA